MLQKQKDMHTLQEKNQNDLWMFLSIRSSDEKKDKSGEKAQENQNGEHEAPGKNPKLVQLEINRGTAVWRLSHTGSNIKLDVFGEVQYEVVLH